MNTCTHCANRSEQDSSFNKSNPWTWMCVGFPQRDNDPVTGEPLPPYHRCRDVLKITRPGPEWACQFFTSKPDVGEPVVTEARGEKSVTFPNKHDAADRQSATETKET